jgi:hypothetical protein
VLVEQDPPPPKSWLVEGGAIMAQSSSAEFDPGADILKDAGFQRPVTSGNVFATLDLPPGKYRININRIAYGVGQPTIANNSSFWIGSSQHTLSSGAILGVPYRYEFYISLLSTTTIKVQANGNGSANIGVSAGVTAVRLA